MEWKYRYIDIHAHVNINAFKDDWKEVIERCRTEGVAHMNVGTQQDTSKKTVEIAEQYEDGVYAVIGLHPIHTTASYHDEKELGGDMKGFTSRGEVFDHDFYHTLGQSNKVLAIGECGLDYYRSSESRRSTTTHMTEREKIESETQYHNDKTAREKQEEAFIAQIELANELEKPLMLHIRASEEKMDAYEDALSIIKKHAKVRGNVHFFAGTYEVARKFWEIGFSTSFTGVITFTQDYQEVVKNAPFEMIHGETDCPYVAPVPYRGKRCEPWMVKEVYKKIAEIRGEDGEKVRRQLVENARNLFQI